MIRYFLLTARARLGTGMRLYLLTLLGVALGVASVLCVQVLSQNAVGAFAGGLRALSGQSDLLVMARAPSMDEALLVDVLGTRGVESAEPMVRVVVALEGDPDAVMTLDVVGLDLYAPRRIPWGEGSGASPDELARALTRRGWVAITPELAAERGLRVGSPLEVSAGSRVVTLEVGALVDFKRLTPLASRRLAVMDISQAQELLGVPGQVDQIDVRVREGASLEEVRDALAARLPESIEVLTPAAQERAGTSILDAFRLNLTALSLISVVVGLFLVHASTLASLARRRRELGVLRSLGATPRQVLALILGEVAVLGGLGVLVGLPLGTLAADWNVDVVSNTLVNIYQLEAIEALVLPWWTAPLALAVGVGGALLGGLGPTLDMARRDTRALLASHTLEETLDRRSGPLLAGSLALVAAATAWYLVFGSGTKAGGFVMATAVLAAVPGMAPALVRALAARAPLRGVGVGFGLRSLGSRLQGPATAAAALAVAVAMMVGITVMVASFRETLKVWIDGAVRADVYVATRSWHLAQGDAPLEDQVVAVLRALPGVESMDRARRFDGWVGDRRLPVMGVDMPLDHARTRFPLLPGEPADAHARFARGEGCLVGEPLYRKAGVRAGDRLPLTTPGGLAEVEVVGVFYDYTSDQGTVVVDLATLTRLFGPAPIGSLSLYLAPGHDADATLEELRRRLPGAPLWLRSNRTMRGEIFAIFDATFAITRILQGLALAIAALGISLALFVMAREQAAETALLRALGARRDQIFRVYAGKGLGMAAAGLALGLAGGAALALVLILVVNRDWFGWTLQIHWPVATLAGQAATVVLAGLLASFSPARRASDTPSEELTRED